MIHKPEEIKAIYDNGGETRDRYTIVLESQSGRIHALLISDNPEHPLGISRFTGGIVGERLGQEIDWAVLPEELQEHVKARVRG